MPTVNPRRLLSGLMLSLCLALPLQAQEQVPADLQESVASLEQQIGELRALSERIESAPARDRDALVYRRDDRSFRLLQELQDLVEAAAALPESDPARLAVMARLQQDLAGAGSGVLARIEDLGSRITELSDQAGGLGGSQLVATEAYIQSLEAMRLHYYQALVGVIEGQAALGVPAEQLSADLLQHLALHGETLVGRIEFFSSALVQVNERQQAEPGNADVTTALADGARALELDLQRLSVIADMQERLGQDPADYRTVLLQHEGLSIGALESGVVVRLLQEGWDALETALVESGPDLLFRALIFIFIILVFRALSRLTRRAVKAACERPGMDMSTLLKDVLQSVCGSTVMVIGILMALAQVGISLGPMLAGLGVAGFVVGFALQDTLGNFAAGGMILIYRPYDVDDFIEVAGVSGLVKKMSLVSTTITTFDNQTLVIPNSKIWGDVIKNVTAQKVRRVDLVFGIGYGDDIPKAEAILGDILEQHDKVLSRPEPLVKLNELADSSVNFVVRPWVRTEDYFDVYWDITREVKMRFDAEGVSIPFPQRDVHLYREEG